MDAASLGAADGQVRPDIAWTRRLRKMLEDTPVAPSLLAACAPLEAHGVDMEVLREVVEETEHMWRQEGRLERLGLPAAFMQFGLAIYTYTLEDPAVYKVINRAIA